MALSVRKKIWYGTAFLFLLLLLTGGGGIYSTLVLKRETKNVIKANYESLSYCHEMQQQTDSFLVEPAMALKKFEAALKLQQGNITEKGELSATNALSAAFAKLKSGDTSQNTLIAIDSHIQHILKLNMDAIYDKNIQAQNAASNALTFTIALATILFLIAFTFSVNFPSIVTKPISELSEAIKQIANKNYAHRIHINNKDEFGELAQAFNEMADRLEYFESSNLNKLLFEKSRAEAVINSLKDASIGIDKNDKILFANFQALQLLGLKAPEIVGKSIDELSARNDLFNYLIKNESSAPFKIVVENRENYFIKETVDVTQEGANSSRVIVLRNITSFKELDVAKTNFIATISHELKTPLAAADFTLKLLEDERVGKLSDEQMELIQSLKQDNKRVLKILSELLNMSQVEAGKIQLNLQLVNPYLIVDSAIENIASTAKERNISIRKVMDEGLPLIQADAEKTTWVLNNFLTNAIKYTSDTGVIEVHVNMDKNEMIFSVIDNGPGIASEYLPRLFERYFQVPGAKAKGTGLGLSISKEFVEAQNGKIWAESEIGKGSKFSFALAT
jgi:NtrC-family two-component system sensor histidine kinase KinB